MKITLKRLREIITEEVIKEEVSPDDATRTIVALLQGTESKVTAEIMGAVYDDMYDADVSEPQADSEEESFPTEYQPGGAHGDRPEIRLGRRDPISETIIEEYYIYMIEKHQALLKEASGPTGKKHAAHLSKAYPSDAIERHRKRTAATTKARRDLAMKDADYRPKPYYWGARNLIHPKTKEQMPAKEWAELILSMGEPASRDPTKYRAEIWRQTGADWGDGEWVDNPEYGGRDYEMAGYDWDFAKAIEAAGFPPSPQEFHGSIRPKHLGHPAAPLPKIMTQWNETNLSDLVDIWDKYIKAGGDIRTAVENTQIEGAKITDVLSSLYKKLTVDADIQQHAS